MSMLLFFNMKYNHTNAFNIYYPHTGLANMHDTIYTYKRMLNTSYIGLQIYTDANSIY